MPITGPLIGRLAEHLSHHTGRSVRITRDVPVGGGSINDGYRLETNTGRFFVKLNAADHSPSMFEAEADGLARLRSTGAIRVPDVIGHGEEQHMSYLLLEHIEGGLKTTAFWEDLGGSLARMHARTSELWGLERDNYIGAHTQVNTPHQRWDTFFIHCRLEPLVKMARDHQRIGMGDVLRFERFYMKLADLFPTEPAALLHGDLWIGNVLCDAHGGPVLIDPAVYFGHREMDIAMTRLFGGFEEAFYSAYADQHPLEKGWEERVEACNLYPLLVHVNLFGGGHAAQLSTILARFA